MQETQKSKWRETQSLVDSKFVQIFNSDIHHLKQTKDGYTSLYDHNCDHELNLIMTKFMTHPVFLHTYSIEV